MVKVNVKDHDVVCLCWILGVFNGAETWRQRHARHHAEGETAGRTVHDDIISSSVLVLCSHSCCPTLFNILVSLSAQLHKQADMQEEKNRIERVLGAISAPDLVQKVLNFALSVNAATFIE